MSDQHKRIFNRGTDKPVTGERKMSVGIMMMGTGIVLSAAALILAIWIAATAKGSKRKIMEEMGRKY